MKLTFRNKVYILTNFSIIVLITTITIVHILNRVKELKHDIIGNATNYVILTTDKIGDAFVRYYKSAFFKFREIIIYQTKLNPDLKEIKIIDPSGNIYYSSKEFEQNKFPIVTLNLQTETDSFITKNIKKLEIKEKVGKDLTIISPYLDEYGVHSVSIIYYFSLERLSTSIGEAIKNSILIAVCFIILGSIIVTIFANRITVHLRVLQDAAREIAKGDFSRIVSIKTGDEFEELAKTFNLMTEEIRKDVRELKNLVNELKKRDEQKTQFLANFSHELRTPLTASMGYIDYLLKQKLGTLNPEQLHGLEVIRRNMERLNKEIHSLIQLSRFSLEGIKLSPRRFSVKEIIDSIVVDFAPDIKNKNLKLNFDFKTLELFADKEHLRTVFENLIANAVKFSQIGGEVKISTLNYTEKDTRYFQFIISNQSDEIPRSKLKKIFEPFYQVDTGTARRYGGFGLGLAIARNIIEAHQGRIWAENQKGLVILKFIIPQEVENVKKYSDSR
ncbi:MAG: HAMP domain-containing sensor histidine kinase [candidate division WOR-3 bacterium]